VVFFGEGQRSGEVKSIGNELLPFSIPRTPLPSGNELRPLFCHNTIENQEVFEANTGRRPCESE
jgi:hypothetical protein